MSSCRAYIDVAIINSLYCGYNGHNNLFILYCDHIMNMTYSCDDIEEYYLII